MQPMGLVTALVVDARMELGEWSNSVPFFEFPSLFSHPSLSPLPATIDIRLKVWQREVVGHTTMRSTVLNLHMPKSDLPQRGELTQTERCAHTYREVRSHRQRGTLTQTERCARTQ